MRGFELLDIIVPLENKQFWQILLLIKLVNAYKHEVNVPLHSESLADTTAASFGGRSGLGAHYGEQHGGVPVPAAPLPYGMSKTRKAELANTCR